jgi:hypothetical protein
LYVTKYGYCNQIKEYDVETETEMCLGLREKSKVKRTFARPRRRWEDVKMERKEKDVRAWSRLFPLRTGKVLG